MQAIKYVFTNNQCNKQKHKGCTRSDGLHIFHATWNWKALHEDLGMHNQNLARVV